MSRQGYQNHVNMGTRDTYIYGVRKFLWTPAFRTFRIVLSRNGWSAAEIGPGDQMWRAINGPPGP